MAKLFRIGKLPSIYQQTGTEAIQPITSEEAFTRSGYQFGQEEQITSEEFENLKSRYGLGTPIYAEQVRPATGATVERITPYEKLPSYIPTPEQYGKIRTGFEAEAGVPKLKTEKAGLWGSLKTAITGLAGFGGKTLEETRSQYGLPEKEQQLTDIDKKIAEVEAGYARGEEAIRQKRVVKHLQTGEIAGLQRQKAIEMNTLYAERAAVSGDYDRAYKNLTTALDLKYKDKQNEITALTTQLDQVKDQMTEADKMVAERLKYQLSTAGTMLERQYKAEDEKNKTVLGLMADFAYAGVTPSDTIEQAMAKIQPYVTQDRMLELQKLELQKKQAKISATQASSQRKVSPQLSYDKISRALYKVGLPTSIVSQKGKLTKANLDALQAVQFSPSTSQQFIDAIIAGATLEDLRDELRKKGFDSSVLDIFMTTLQKPKEGWD